MSHTTTVEPIDAFLAALRKAVGEGTFVKLTLGKYRGDDRELRRVIVQRIETRKGERLAFTYRYRTRDESANYSPGEAEKILGELLGASFRSAHLSLTATAIELEFNKRGRASIRRRRHAEAAPPSSSHNREKQRLIDAGRPFLRALGVTGEDGKDTEWAVAE